MKVLIKLQKCEVKIKIKKCGEKQESKDNPRQNSEGITARIASARQIMIERKKEREKKDENLASQLVPLSSG